MNEKTVCAKTVWARVRMLCCAFWEARGVLDHPGCRCLAPLEGEAAEGSAKAPSEMVGAGAGPFGGRESLAALLGGGLEGSGDGEADGDEPARDPEADEALGGHLVLCAFLERRRLPHPRLQPQRLPRPEPRPHVLPQPEMAHPEDVQRLLPPPLHVLRLQKLPQHPHRAPHVRQAPLRVRQAPPQPQAALGDLAGVPGAGGG
eukprot:CAMPEP_0119148190 /NCGR_PEP_ID=MMETSP1310-20130426/41478_1 /TAXON_ID=464262 /ORGANISM="Genus nov. species nov., Strain RCC2339" /LENGTH=202 /DNA_ID=CAMNT_0007140213 /DNA_START=39 /DNA_END=644 /DNA_ORIENTATION=-